MFETIALERSGPVATLTLNRPASVNTINVTLARELMAAAIALDEDPDVRAVVLTGAGDFFCAGGDLKSFAATGDKIGAHLKEITAYLHSAISRLRRMAAPLVVAVNGPAAGAGLSLAIAGDLVLASPRAQFSAAYTGVGFSPDGGLSYLLPRLVGLRRAQELLFTNRRLNAQEAYEWGLVTRVVPQPELYSVVRTLASELAAGPKGAHGAIKALLADSLQADLEIQLEREARAIALQAQGPEGREGVAAFLAKRKPLFPGAG